MGTSNQPEENPIGMVFQFVVNSNASGAYSNPDEFEGFEEQQQSKAEAREAAVEQFRAAAQKVSRGLIINTVNQLLAHLIQYRAVGGSLAGTDIPEMMKGALAFMEDL